MASKVGIYNHVFLASDEELQEALPTRIPPAEQPTTREISDPKSKRKQLVKCWQPVRPFSPSVTKKNYPTKTEWDAVKRFPKDLIEQRRAEHNRVAPGKPL